MTDADATWKSKLSRLQDPNLEKMKPLVELMGELRERRQERGRVLERGQRPLESILVGLFPILILLGLHVDLSTRDDSGP